MRWRAASTSARSGTGDTVMARVYHGPPHAMSQPAMGRTVPALHADHAISGDHELSLSELVVPCVMIDVRSECGDDRDFALQAHHVRQFEADHGPIPKGSAALVCTGWDRFLSDHDAYVGPESGPARCPGLSAAAMQYLVQRRVAGVGIDTLSVDPGKSTDLPAHRVSLAASLWHLEGLIGLHRLPALGAWIAVGVMPIVDGSGAPARVLSFVPAK